MLLLQYITLVYQLLVVVSIDPADFFKGAKPRPKLEILFPENGAILDDDNLEIRVSIEGYTFPSPFHDSSVCIGLSTGDTFLEECFVEAPDLNFHIAGLKADSGYAARVIFFERGDAIAVSVRNFRVGGLKGIVEHNEDEVVTIQTAVQLAINYQLNGQYDDASRIYNSILAINPIHPHTLHLLGLNSFQSGDAEGALPYLHKALIAIEKTNTPGDMDSVVFLSDKTGHDGFHNSLGECYRVLGRYEEAENHYKLALVINPHHIQVKYNLGILYQVTNRLSDAMHLYKQLVLSYEPVSAHSEKYESRKSEWKLGDLHDEGIDEGEISREEQTEMFLNAKIRECDILQKLVISKEWHYSHLASNGRQYVFEYLHPKDDKDFSTTDASDSDAYQAVANCWLHGLELFPESHVMYNELGNLLLQVGQYNDAVPIYRTAVSLGNKLAQVNLAHVLESMGHFEESRESFQSLVVHAMEGKLPYTHFLLRQITVTPRILPSNEHLNALRSKMNIDLDMFLLLDNSRDNFYVDNSAPLHFGFYTGFYWTYQLNSMALGNNIPNSTNINNVVLKTKLYHAYLKYCPALSNGVFVEGMGRYGSKDNVSTPNANRSELTGDHFNESGISTNVFAENSASLSSSFESKNPMYFRLLYTHADEIYLRMHAEGGVKIVDLASVDTAGGVGVDPLHISSSDNALNKMPYSSTIEFSRRKLSKRIHVNGDSIDSLSLTEPVATGGSHATNSPIKIGFISRFFRVHAVGILSEGIIQALSEFEQYEIHVFFIDGNTQEMKVPSGAYDHSAHNLYHDPVQMHIITHADYTYYLSTDISEISQFVKSLNLDILIYPEVGIDIVCYFLAFSRLAKVQAAWIGHPDTTGINTIDYFITTDMLPEFLVEANKLKMSGCTMSPHVTFDRFTKLDKKQAKLIYHQQQSEKANSALASECEHVVHTYNGEYSSYAPAISQHTSTSFSEDNVYLLSNMGTYFKDKYAEYAKLLKESPRTALLDRSKFIDYMRLPKTAHILLIAQPLYKLHTVFDEVVTKVLLQDRLAYLIIVDSVNVSSWQNLYIDRLSRRHSVDIKERVIFFVASTLEDTLTAMAAAHVLLDPFPVSGYLANLQALSIGLPVVTLPSDSLAGRMGLILYNMIGYYDLVCSTAQSYVSSIHSITHNPKVRAAHVQQIIAKRGALFDSSGVVKDWQRMIAYMMKHSV